MFTRALANKSLPSNLDRERLLALDKISSVGLFMIGIMALAEACGVAVQSIMTVGGIGGKDGYTHYLFYSRLRNVCKLTFILLLIFTLCKDCY